MFKDMFSGDFYKTNEKARAYIREKLNISAPDRDVQPIRDFLSGKTNQLSGEIYAAKVDGVSTHNYAETHKNDLPMMLRCCEEELKNMAKHGGSPAPFYFMRVAILASKKKDYELEIQICELIIKALLIYKEAYDKQMKQHPLNMAGVSDDFEKRLSKAREKLKKQQLGVSKPARKATQRRVTNGFNKLS
jgi:hypothetical protein